jgi:hypothetical protein
MKSYKQIIESVISEGFILVERNEFEKFNGQKIVFHNAEQTFYFLGADYNFKQGSLLKIKRSGTVCKIEELKTK